MRERISSVLFMNESELSVYMLCENNVQGSRSSPVVLGRCALCMLECCMVGPVTGDGSMLVVVAGWLRYNMMMSVVIFQYQFRVR